MAIAAGPETRVNTYTDDDQDNPQITALTDGGWVVTWNSSGQDGSDYGVYLQAYDADGDQRGAETRVSSLTNDDQGNPQITALTDGGWVVTWVFYGQDGLDDGVYQQAYDADGNARGAETRVNTYAYNDQRIPKVTALVDGGWVVTWHSSGQDGFSHGVYQQAYDADGDARGAETRVNTYTDYDRRDPQIAALTDGGWVVTWHSNFQDGSDYGVYQQAYDADGDARGAETRVNTHTYGEQSSPQITALSDGGWVVTWNSYAQDGSGYGVYQQAYDADGDARGAETRVNTYTNDYQRLSQITALTDGGWVVTWNSYDQDGSGDGVYQQGYDADGDARGAETRVNAHTEYGQRSPQVTALTDGGWVVTWVSISQDGSGPGVYQQAYDADGTARGADTRVNTYTDGTQDDPQIAALADGGWVVTWNSLAQDGSGYGVYQRTFWTNDAPVVASTISAQQATEDAGFSFTVDAATFSDPDIFDTLVYSATLSSGGALPAWLGFDATTRTFSGTPGNGDVGNASIELTATDTSGASTSTSFVLAVANVNDAPLVASTISAQQATEGAGFSFTVDAATFSDPDISDTLVYSATLSSGGALPGWLSFDAATRTFSGTPGNGDVGSANIRLTATDTSGASTSTSFLLAIANVNDAPVVADSTAATLENAAITIDVLSAASDVDGDTLSVASASVVSGFGSVTIGDDGRLTYDPTTAKNQDISEGESRTVVIRHTISDGNGGTATATVTITVGGVSNDVIVGTADNDTVEGSAGNDELHGYAGSDDLDGSGGDDRLFGGGGHDRLTGGLGADQLRGGAGADTFVFTSIDDSTTDASGRDTILAFSRKQGDRIDLRQIDAVSRTARDDRFTFIGDDDFSGKAGELRYLKKGDETFLRGDVDGDGKADFAIGFDASIHFVKADFLL